MRQLFSRYFILLEKLRGIKKNFPSFCVQGIQNFLGARSSNLVGTLAEDNRWYKKLSARVISFLSKDFWLLLEIYLMASYIQYNGIYNKSFGRFIISLFKLITFVIFPPNNSYY